MAKINGTDFLVYVDNVAIGASTSCTLNLNAAMIDITSKDSAGWKEVLPGLRDWSIDVEGLYDPAQTFDAEELFDALDTRDEVTIKFSTTEVGATYYTGYAYVTNLKISAPMEDKTTITCTFVGTADLNKATVSGS
jgi:TP901-1 family phage major tail protein